VIVAATGLPKMAGRVMRASRARAFLFFLFFCFYFICFYLLAHFANFNPLISLAKIFSENILKRSESF
jgi:hypothetical protein